MEAYSHMYVYGLPVPVTYYYNYTKSVLNYFNKLAVNIFDDVFFLVPLAVESLHS